LQAFTVKWISIPLTRHVTACLPANAKNSLVLSRRRDVNNEIKITHNKYCCGAVKGIKEREKSALIYCAMMKYPCLILLLSISILSPRCCWITFVQTIFLPLPPSPPSPLQILWVIYWICGEIASFLCPFIELIYLVPATQMMKFEITHWRWCNSHHKKNSKLKKLIWWLE
jgi:hypothetical protein